MKAIFEMWYSLFKYLGLGPLVWFFARPTIDGADRIPKRGPVILAANHRAEIDSFVLAFTIRRRLTFIAKLEYFTGAGLRGRIQKWFYEAVGQIPVDRSGGDAGERALDAARGVLKTGSAWALYPEGTRSPDGRLFKAHTGIARVALSSPRALIVPVAILGSEKVDPSDARGWRRGRIHVRVGEPMDLGEWEVRRHEPGVYRELADAVMEAIGDLAGQDVTYRYPTQTERAARDAGTASDKGTAPDAGALSDRGVARAGSRRGPRAAPSRGCSGP